MGASPFVFIATQKSSAIWLRKGKGGGYDSRTPLISIQRGFMRYKLNTSLAAVLMMSACVALPSPADAAVQRFTDEAGVVIYTIDDDGVVSMFESRPGTDITLSVTRGTREQMQPQITEVTPKDRKSVV